MPLGYQVIERKLLPVPEEAERVRAIMRRYLETRNVPRLIEVLRAEGIVTKVQQRTSGPHRGGIPFARGSLFYLLKNPVYRGKIVHKGKVYDGEHEAIVAAELWDAVQAQLAAKAPPRKRLKNDRNRALLNGIITDPEDRPAVPTYASKGTRHYAFYETRKDLARPGDPPATRFQQGALDRAIVTGITDLLGNEHAMRRLANIDEASRLQGMLNQACLLLQRLRHPGELHSAVRTLVTGVRIRSDHLEVELEPAALGVEAQAPWTFCTPRPTKRPFREARLRIDAASPNAKVNQQLVQLLSDALEVQQLVLATPDLSLNQIAKRDGRCRKQLAKLFNISWLSPRIVESIIDGTQPRSINRTRLLAADLPFDWAEQEALFSFAA